jgi:hypothetical protein
MEKQERRIIANSFLPEKSVAPENVEFLDQKYRLGNLFGPVDGIR